MDFDDYQHKALSTDQRPDGLDSIAIPLLGLAGETGTMLSEYKKYLRDGAGHVSYPSLVAEELGDVLWYVSNLASKFGLSLSSIAEANLVKVGDRWISERRSYPAFFDEVFSPTEQLPRTFAIRFNEQCVGARPRVTAELDDGQRYGEPLTDAAPLDDGYRYHDALHLAFATFLAWSPVTRRNLGRKRRSDPLIDDVQDGGRAIVIEEAVAAHAYIYAQRHNLLEHIDAVDHSTLRTIRELAAPFEVSVRTAAEWQLAIVEGFRMFRLLIQHNGGTIRGDLYDRVMVFESPSD